MKSLTSLVIAGYPKNEFKFNFKLAKKQQNQKVSLDYSQKRDSSSGTEKTFNSE